MLMASCHENAIKYRTKIKITNEEANQLPHYGFGVKSMNNDGYQMIIKENNEKIGRQIKTQWRIRKLVIKQTQTAWNNKMPPT